MPKKQTRARADLEAVIAVLRKRVDELTQSVADQRSQIQSLIRDKDEIDRAFFAYRAAPTRLSNAVLAFLNDLDSGKTIEVSLARTMASLIREVGADRAHAFPEHRR